MDAFFEVHLGDRVQTNFIEQIDQQPRLHAVAREERHPFERCSSAGVLPGQRLNHARQLRIKKIE